MMGVLDRQPMNPQIVQEITDELMKPVSEYRHERPHVREIEPNYTSIAKRPRRVKASKDDL